MHIGSEGLILSASDLVNFLGCAHASYLDLRQLTEPVDVAETDDVVALVRAKGLEHERAYLAELKAQGRAVAEIPSDGMSPAERAALTRQAMRRGVGVIYQGALLALPWLGFADFLERVDEASGLGPWSYEPVDTKLARRAKPDHLVQLATYARLIGIEQGRMPAQMHVLLGTNERVSLRVADFAHYHSIAQERLVAFANCPPAASAPEPCGRCSVCRWIDRCEAEWEAADHLSLVANITRNQRARLCDAGVQTVRRLAVVSDGTRIPRLQPETVVRLRSQAGLQIAKRDTGLNHRELLPAMPSKGFARLPTPDPGDIFFDMEGDPFFGDRSLEYLFGFVANDGTSPRFTSFWAHDRAAEKCAFEHAMDFITARLEQHPDAFVYHYAAYEESALKRLAMVHGTRETQVDDLLRHRKLVDLYKVVREAIRISEPRYSLKNLETFYGADRAGDVTTAMDSVVAYEHWRETDNVALLDQIAVYNEADCRSLLMCRDWLVSLKPAEIAWFTGAPLSDSDVRALDPERVANRRAAEERSAALAGRLLAGVPEAERPWRELAGHLLDFHRREAKPVWWAMFHRREMTEEELIDDADCIGGLRADPDRRPFADKRSIVYPYRFPAQDFKLHLGETPLVSDTLAPAGEIVRIDDERFEISLRLSNKRDPPPSALSLIPGGPVGDEVLRNAIARYAVAVADGHEARYPGITGILRRDFPRFRGPTTVAEGADDVARAIDAIRRLDQSHLLIQGPPGGGKTYCASQAIVDLLARGNRIGVSSHSHKAINNLLSAVEKVAIERKLNFRGVKKSTYEEQYLSGTIIEDTEDNEYATGSGHALIAGTAWLFARTELDQRLDYLFIDEAGQVSLANTIAMGVSARNIILVGDQMQLAQPIQGTHPGRSGLSALEHLLDDLATVPPERGIFLSKTRRMHPDLCRFVSGAFYDGRLLPEPGNERQGLILGPGADPALASAGLRFVTVEHEGCAQRSQEEADCILSLYASLLGQRWMDREGRVHPIGVEDILVVSPYNMQVNLLRTCLPAGARVGTVDKFQGQEAAVVLISMATSSGDDLSRQIDFLYSRNRLNVAVSRARCLAAIVASPKLLAASCSTIEQMRLVNALCLAKDYAAW